MSDLPPWFTVAVGFFGGIGTITAGAGAMYAIIRKALVAVVTPIVYELSPNGGESFRDKVTHAQTSLDARISRVEDAVLDIDHKLDDLVLKLVGK